MRLVEIPIEQAVGGVLVHNIADDQGHKAFSKGHRLTAADVAKLHELGKAQVFVGLYQDGDVPENEAAARIARAVAGENVELSPVSSGRVNLLASRRGILQVDVQALLEINSIDGVTIATLPANIVVQPKKMVATIKVIGLAVPGAALDSVERIGQRSEGVMRVRALRAVRAAVILTGSQEARARIEKTFLPPIQGRIEELGGTVVLEEYAAHSADAVAQALERAKQQRADLVILAGETSIMNLEDVTPSGIVKAGGVIELYGAPVEPGNLLLLAYAGELPIVGAPGCVKSRETNVVDLILPRLFAGERVGKKEIIALANGGLMI